MKKAIDIVILPPKEVVDLCIELNRTEESSGMLDKESYFPHITLLMDCIKDLEKVSRMVENLAAKFLPLDLNLTKVYWASRFDGTKSYGLEIEKSKDITKLHELLLAELTPLLTWDATKESLFEPKSEPQYINDFKEKHSFENFNPHITLRCTNVKSEVKPFSFKGSRIAICHLGEEGTVCRKIIWEKEIKQESTN